jgi:hypothetical protein
MMSTMSRRTISSLRAARPRVDVVNDRGERRTGFGDVVQLRGVADWLTNGQMITADLTPDQATALAVELLTTAQTVRKSLVDQESDQ